MNNIRNKFRRLIDVDHTTNDRWKA